MVIHLNDIIKVKRREVDAACNTMPLNALKQAMKDCPPCRDFYRTLNQKAVRGINVITEIKKASPSAGIIRPHFDPVALTKTYAHAGADALSVLTDETFFQGQLNFIKQIKDAVDLPVLRKDFIIDPYQVYQSRLAGADAILLIAEALDFEQLKELLDLAHSLTLTTLLEVHERDSLLKVQEHIADFDSRRCLLGINNRNLKTMQVDISHSLDLLPDVRRPCCVISESGIKTPDHVRRLTAAGFNGLLIGETLMRADDLATAFAELFD